MKVRKGGGEEILLIQGKRNPSKTVDVARGHQRADTLKPYSQKTSQSNHTRTTALSNSMKLSHAHGATQDTRAWWRGLTECGPLEKGMVNHFSILALIPHESMKRQKDKTLKEELLRSVDAQYATGDQWRNNSRKNEGMEPKQKQHPAVDVTGDRSKV